MFRFKSSAWIANWKNFLKLEKFSVKTHQMFSVHTMPEEFENGGFSPKTRQMFLAHTAPEEYKNAAIISNFRPRPH